MSRLIAGAKFLLGLQPPGRNLDVFPDDVFLVSYPKSGNTWTRFLIGNLISLHERADFSSINRIIPDPEALTKRSANALPRPRILKSHQYFDPRYPKVVYIVRDPRDVAVSQYHFQRKRRVIEDGSPIEDFVRGFITGQSSIYGSWGENAASWLAARNGRPNFLLMRYEDMLEDTHSELAKIASFLGVSASAEHLRRAVENSSADQMRKLEKSQAHLWSSTKDTRQDVPFVRAATASGWKSELPDESVAEIESEWGTLMRFLRYDLATNNRDGVDADAALLLQGRNTDRV
jgi:Sulfotransferase domain